jgi:hypothetical protein
MLSVEPGSVNVIAVPLEFWLTLSLELSTTAILKELLCALNTSVDLLLGNKVINPGTGLTLETETVDVESTSFVASMMFNTGAVEIIAGDSGLETKTRNLSPLAALPELELEVPQEVNEAVAIRTAQTGAKAFFKTEAPKRIGDGELDARSADYNRVRRKLLGRHHILTLEPASPDGCKSRSHLVFST